MSVWVVLVAVVLLLANGFFVAVEFALVASRRTKLEAMADGGNRAAGRSLDAIRDLSKQLAGAQLGITICSLLLGYVAEPAVSHALEGVLHGHVPESVSTTVGFALGLFIVVFLHMVLGEMVPKNIAIAGPERTAVMLELPNRIYLKIFGPAISVLNALANGLLRLMGIPAADEVSESHTYGELADMVAAQPRGRADPGRPGPAPARRAGHRRIARGADGRAP